MKLVKRNNDFFNAFPSLVNDFFGNDLKNWFADGKLDSTVPAVNVKEEKDKYEIEVAAPGLNKDEFKIELDHDVLTVSAEKKNESEQKDDNYYRREFSYSSFKRSFALPEDTTNHEKISAKYDKGVLYIQVPKKEHVKVQPKEIKIV